MGYFKKQILFVPFLLLAILLNSCNIQKRLYTKGFYLSKSSNSDVLNKTPKNKALYSTAKKATKFKESTDIIIPRSNRSPLLLTASVVRKNRVLQYPKNHFTLETSVFKTFSDTLKVKRIIKKDDRTPAEILADQSLIWLLLTFIISVIGLIVALIKSARALYLNKRAEIYSERAQRIATTVLIVSIIFLALAISVVTFAIVFSSL